MSKSSAWMRRSAVTTFKHIVGVGAVLLLFAAGGCAPPVPQSVLQQLPAAQARELQVYSTQHAYVFDPRLHSMNTCPFLTYLPTVASPRQDTPEFAARLHRFFTHKHEEERFFYRCKCEEKLLAPVEPNSTAGR